MTTIIKKLAISIIAMGLLPMAAHAAETAPTKGNHEIILHAWSWSFNTIRQHLPEIKDAGFTAQRKISGGKHKSL